VLSQATDKPHVILLGGHPDPDAIGSALAHRRICDRLGISATIAHVLPLSRSENRALVKLLNVPMLRIDKSEDLEEFGYLALVDTVAPESTITIPSDLELLTVVDHHRLGWDLAVITVQPDHPVSYRAGQYVSVEVPQRPRLWRDMTPANAPRDNGSIEFHIRGGAEGWSGGSTLGRILAGRFYSQPNGFRQSERPST
jgi:hypothetical protein